MKAKASPHSPVPAYAVEVDRVGLRRVDGDVERDALVLIDADRRCVPLDLPGRIVPPLRPKPVVGAGLLVLQDNRIVGGERRARRDHPGEQADQGRHHDPSQPHRCRSFAAGTVGALPSTMWRSWSWTPHSPMAASPWYQKPAAAALIGETRSWPSKMRSPLSLVKV